MRLIDADKLKEALCNECTYAALEDCCENCLSIKTIDGMPTETNIGFTHCCDCTYYCGGFCFNGLGLATTIRIADPDYGCTRGMLRKQS